MLAERLCLPEILAGWGWDLLLPVGQGEGTTPSPGDTPLPWAVLSRGLRAPLGESYPPLRKLRFGGPVRRAGSRPDSWIAMAKTVSGLFKRETC